MKKCFLFVLTIFALMAQGVYAEGDDIWDKELDFLHDNNIMVGDPSGDLRAEDEITRAEFTAVLCRAIGIEDVAQSAEMTSKSTYIDVPVGHWAVGYVNAATECGAINGMGDGYFYPDMPVTNEQAIKILVAAWGYGTEADKNGGYPNGYMEIAKQFGITDSLLFNYGVASKRWVVSVFTYNMLSVSPNNITLKLPVRTTIDDEIAARAENRLKYVEDPVSLLKKITPETVNYERTIFEQTVPYGAPFPLAIEGDTLIYTGPKQVSAISIMIGGSGGKTNLLNDELLTKSEVDLSQLPDGKHESILNIKEGAIVDTYYFTVAVLAGNYEIRQYRQRYTCLQIQPVIERQVQVIELTAKNTDILPFGISVSLENGRPVLQFTYPEKIDESEYFQYDFTTDRLKTICDRIDGENKPMEPIAITELEFNQRYSLYAGICNIDGSQQSIKGIFELVQTAEGIDYIFQANYHVIKKKGFEIRN